MTAVTISQARDELFPLVRQVNEDHTVVEIVSRNGGNAVLMSADDYASMQETLYLLSSPANAIALARSIDQLHAGDVVQVDLDEIRAQIGDAAK